MMSDPESIVALLFWTTQTYALYVVLRSVLAPSRHRAASWVTDELAQWAVLDMKVCRDKSTPRPDLWAGRYPEPPHTTAEIAEAGADYLERSDTSYAHHNRRLRDHARN